LTTEQQRGLEDIFQQTRPQLIDLSAALQKEEAILEPLLGAEHPQETRVLAQIDRVADARAALEKADARMLFRFRTLLSGDQWTQLQNMQPGPQPGGPGGRHGPPGGGRN
jgi:Spy/CpxP family protein refolding chaperone